ncbi:MAG TPA: acetyl-CoA carboxylase biotin carboxyl carrier protein [Terracidiphilus sp.]|jgi:acetyl-CoA carboxylase biotin carboxyl carrier protein|nr:acetyl-CoA carboxylase biotin carboxyl carrier protein [Terracidiphilus sp.]
MKQEDIQDLKELIEFLKQHGVAEFDVDRGDLKIRLKFTQPAAPAALADLARAWASAPAMPAPQSHPVTPSHIAASAAPAAAPAPAEELHTVKSPIVGTFYGSPSPGASSFVSTGDHVDKGQVVCIVEAMKLMNEIESDVAGEIVKCLVTNGQPIEFGQPLFSIRVN